MFLTIETENNKELLEKYGLAVLLNNSVEYLVGEVIIFRSGLNKADQDIVNRIFDKIGFKAKIDILKNVLNNNEIYKKLEQIIEDRNLLAHGVNVQRENDQFLLFKRNYHPLTSEIIQEVINRAREVSKLLLSNFQINK